jgi:formiminoglutamate deiminase
VTPYWCEYAWLGGARPVVARDVLIDVVDGRIAAVTPGVAEHPPGAVRRRGLTLPGLANVHSHAFHRALRGRTHGQRGTFWTWREKMYAAAARLTPDTYLELATAVYAEMALAGITTVGEFHYLHHAPGGVRYDDPNAMGRAVAEAARRAGIRLTLLDTCYVTGGFDHPLSGPQLRFGDGDADAWAGRVADLCDAPGFRVGVAAHSVRAVPLDQIPAVAAFAAARSAPLHAHLSEQVAENQACRAAYGRTPTQVFADTGVLGPRATAVHATHLTGEDIELIGATGTGVCVCPTTERDLSDGIGPARELADAGAPLSLGTDSQAVIDPFEEARAVELDERLRTHERGHFTVAELLTAATGAGHAALGWHDAGAIEPGARADLVTVGLAGTRLAGLDPEAVDAAVLFAATATDVTDVVADGRAIVVDGKHTAVDDVSGELHRTITDLMTD